MDDLSVPDHPEPTTLEAVIKVAQATTPKLEQLLGKIVATI